MSRPLIISDCDGVLLEFADPFIAYLDAVHGLTLKLESFALAGNIRHPDGTPVAPAEFPALLDGFFTTHMPTQTPIAGAVHALAALAEQCDVVVLTNIADHHAVSRTAELARLGMPKEIVMRHRLPQFNHLFTSDAYSAGYYSYLWSEVMDADTWAYFEESGDVFNPDIARRYKAIILAEGNTTDRAEAYRRFRGRDPDVTALLKVRGFPVS